MYEKGQGREGRGWTGKERGWEGEWKEERDRLLLLSVISQKFTHIKVCISNSFHFLVDSIPLYEDHFLLI